LRSRSHPTDSSGSRVVIGRIPNCIAVVTIGWNRTWYSRVCIEAEVEGRARGSKFKGIDLNAVCYVLEEGVGVVGS
jgi:hypothetical protein